MEITREEIKKMVGLLPGYAAAYTLGNGLHRICYSRTLPELVGYTPEEYEALSDCDVADLVAPADRPSLTERLSGFARGEGEADPDREIQCGYHLLKKDGTTVQVWSKVRKIGEADGLPVILAVLTRASLEEMQRDMLNRVPVGMGIYKIENGVPSLVFLNDSYYNLMGFTRSERAAYLGVNTINAVYPADRPLILRGLARVASGETEESGVVVRMATGADEKMTHWVQMEGRVARRDGATLYLYVSFTKIDELKNAQEELLRAKAQLEKSSSWLQSAMDSAGVRYFEYFPTEKRAVSYGGAGERIDIRHERLNFPASMCEQGKVLPEDAAGFLAFWQRVNDGESPARWEGRLGREGQYRWNRLIATAVHEEGAGNRVVTCTQTDIHLQREADERYRNHTDSVLRANPDTLALLRLNVTQNRSGDAVSDDPALLGLTAGGSMESFLENMLGRIPDRDGRSRVRTAFDRAAVLAAFEGGKKTISVEHRFCLTGDRTEWLNTILDLMKNPETGDVEGVLYTLCTTDKQMSHLVLKNLLNRWYDSVSVVDIKTDEYYMFDRQRGMHGVHGTHFFDRHDESAKRYLSEEEWQRLEPQLCADTVRKMLLKQGSYFTNFFTVVDGRLCRKQSNYYYTDRSHTTLIASLRDFSDSDLVEEFRYASEHDPITDLYNRRKTFHEVRKMLDSYPNEQFYICHMDLQRFHLVNSFYGEKVGNDILAGLGRQLARISMHYPYAVYGRIEADVFCCCIPMMKEALEADTRAIKQWLSEYPLDFQLEACFGAYLITDRCMGVPAMFARATLAAKSSRHSQFLHYGYYNDAMERELQTEQMVSAEMKSALESEQFKVYLQPKVELQNATDSGAEALVRWQHPTRGLIAPNDFIPLFEKNGFILQLDRYMWEAVCKLLRRWLDEGKSPQPISVNVSRVSMCSPATVGFLHSLVQKYSLPPRLLQLELTETAYMDDPDEMKNRLERLQDYGFTILMDDFGSGYSSLNTLRELPVDYLKVDMRFLQNCEGEQRQRSRLILAAVIRMAQNLALPVITEGVETEEQRQFLLGIDCTYAQGYLFAKPIPVPEYEKRVFGQA